MRHGAPALLPHSRQAVLCAVISAVASACPAPATSQPDVGATVVARQTHDATPPAEAPVLTLTKKDHGRIIPVRAGQPVVIELYGNPTTGYDWGVEQGSSGLGPPVEEYIPSAEHEGAGALKRMTWNTSGAPQREIQIRLCYTRKRGDCNTALERFSVTLQISRP